MVALGGNKIKSEVTVVSLAKSQSDKIGNWEGLFGTTAQLDASHIKRIEYLGICGSWPIGHLKVISKIVVESL